MAGLAGTECISAPAGLSLILLEETRSLASVFQVT